MRFHLPSVCDLAKAGEREKCKLVPRLDRSYLLVVEWQAGSDALGNDVWHWIPAADYWLTRYYNKYYHSDWKWGTSPHVHLLDNCTYRIPVNPGPGHYRIRIRPNTEPENEIRQEFSVDVKPGESVTLEFDPEDFKSMTYHVDPTPEKEPKCIVGE